MANDPEAEGKRPSLRERAEALLANMALPEGEWSVEEQRALISELRVHQAELELQNEELQQAREALRRARDRYRDLYDSAPVGYLTVHHDGRITDANTTSMTLLAQSRESLLRSRLYTYVRAEDRGAFFSHRQELYATCQPQTCEVGLCRGDGSEFEAHLLSAPIVGDDGRTEGYRTVITDVTDRHTAERRWRLADSLVEASSDAIAVIDEGLSIVRVNRAFARLTGFGIEEAHATRLTSLITGSSGRELFNTLMYDSGREHWSGEIWVRRSDGEVFPARATVTALPHTELTSRHRALVFEDITERRRMEEQLRFSAYYDPVTGLPNRVLFRERLLQHTREAERAGTRLALLFLDLNRFKQINDTLGHAVGDELLWRGARRLRDVVRASDTVARIGGDEFAVVLPDIEDGHAAGLAAEKILNAIAHPLDVGGSRVSCSASIGITIYPDDSPELETLYRYSDLSMYRAKQESRSAGTFRFFAASMNAEACEHGQLEQELAEAIDADQFELYYQPVRDIANRQLAGAETLLRWHHPRHGLLQPADSTFLRVAEESGQIGRIGQWVFATARNAALQREERLGRALPSTTINVSPQQLMHTEDFNAMRDMFMEGAMPQGGLALEITETTAVGIESVGVQRLETLRQAGAVLVMDDFGTGYSSLSYLRQLPFNALKIDSSFVRDITTCRDSEQLVEAIVSMAHALDLCVVAEGVEDAKQFECVRRHGCDYAQGYYLGAPLSASDFDQLLEAELSSA